MAVTRTIDVRAGGPVLPAPPRTSLRLQLLRRSASMMFTSLAGAVLFSAWITVVAVSPITVGALLLLPATAVVRGYANVHRRGAGRLLGTPIPAPYRTDERPGAFTRIWTIIRDPASWRDATWLLLHSIVGFLTSTLAVVLFAGSVFYLIYPFLYWVTPQSVFGTPFGDWRELHSVAGATVMMPFALVSFGLWLALQVPLTRAELALSRSLLGPRAQAR
ncbi:MAG: sensor domain-containing protein [Nocardia sp.]|nr:sensor domain-containing protein [Nocardia sp.]